MTYILRYNDDRSMTVREMEANAALLILAGSETKSCRSTSVSNRRWTLFVAKVNESSRIFVSLFGSRVEMVFVSLKVLALARPLLVYHFLAPILRTLLPKRLTKMREDSFTLATNKVHRRLETEVERCQKMID
jgi:hypothetical protein